MDWDERYGGEGFLFGTEPAAFLTRHAGRFAPGDRVLCVADGEGRNSVWLAAQGCRVAAWDASAVALAKARRLAQARGVAVGFSLAAAEDYAWPDAAFDAVVAIFIQFAGPDLRRRIFAGMKRAVRPGGLILLHGYTPRQLDHGTGGPRQVENLYIPQILQDAFAGWDIPVLRSYEAHLAEGTAHAGPSALIDLIARRPG